MTSRIDEVAEGIYRTQAEVPGGFANFTIYFIKGGGNVLIEPGPGALIPAIRAAAGELGLDGFQYIIPTHIHMDHAGATGQLVRVFPGAKAVINPYGARHVIDPSRLVRSTKMAFGDDFENIYGAIEPVPEAQVKIVRDGEKLAVDGRELVIIETPGHAPHHIAIFDVKTGSLFCGEALGLMHAYSQPLPSATPPAFDLEMYVGSMEKLRELPVELLLYSHGGTGREPDKMISRAIENSRSVGEAILQALKTEGTEEGVAGRVRGYVKERLGVEMGGYDLASNVSGYTDYFKKQGLV